MTLREKLAMLDGDPPYDTGSNICYGDGYFAKSIEREFGASLEELRKQANKPAPTPAESREREAKMFDNLH